MAPSLDQWTRRRDTRRVGLAFINELSRRYVGAPYPRTAPREIFVITPDKVRAFMGRR